MKKSLKKKGLVELYNTLKSMSNGQVTKALGYALLVNLNNLESHVKALQDMGKPSDKFIEFEKKRVALITSYCKKDSAGSPMVLPNGAADVLEESKSELMTKLSELLNENNEVLKEHSSFQKEIADLLETESEVELDTISFKLLPEKLEFKDIEVLTPVIKETRSEIMEIINNV